MHPRFLIASLLLCTPLIAHADCTDRLAEWAHTLHPERSADSDHAVCKAWPANPAHTLAVLPWPQQGASEDETTYDLEILVADSATGKIIAHRYEPSAITSDAIRLDRIALDTAAWQLTPQQRAFGVSANYEGASRVAPFGATVLSLYVLEGTQLRRVLGDLTTQQNTGDWDGNCAGDFSATTRTLSIGPVGKKGYAALKIAEKIVETSNTPIEKECASKSTTGKRTSYTLDYDGASYNVPKALKYE
jgi:hypothetical protein